MSLISRNNLIIDNSETYSRVNDTTVATVCCIGCFTHMGYNIVQVENPHDIIREGRLVIDLRKLLLWNGQLTMGTKRMQLTDDR